MCVACVSTRSDRLQEIILCGTDKRWDGQALAESQQAQKVKVKEKAEGKEEEERRRSGKCKVEGRFCKTADHRTERFSKNQDVRKVEGPSMVFKQASGGSVRRGEEDVGQGPYPGTGGPPRP